MATVTIPYGGQSITVDVSDLASEATLKDLFVESSKQSALLSSIAQRLGADVQKEINAEDRNTDKLIRAIQEEGRKSDSRLGGMFRRFGGGMSGLSRGVSGGAAKAGGLFNSVTSSAGEESGSRLTEGVFGALGLSAMGAQLGTLFGIFEEFGNSMANLRRVGTGYAEDLQDFRAGAAEIGLSLEQFGEITHQSGLAIRTLGDNTTDGAKRLLNLTNTFRANTREFGYFGLQSKEMARLIADEAEIKRGILQSDLSSKQAQDELVSSLENQLKLNEQMATLTGQDIRDRIKASQQFRQDAVNSAMLSRLNEDQRVAANSVIEGLTQLGGSAGPMLDKAISNLLGGLPMDAMNDGFSEFAAFAQSEGINLRSSLQELQQMIMSGVDPKTIASASDQLANQFKELTPSDSIIQQGLVGSRGAVAVLNARMESVSSGADTLAGSVEKISEAAEKMATAAEAGQLALSGTAAEMGRFAAELRNTLMNEITDAFDMDISSNEFPKFIRSLADLPSSEGFKDAISFMTETTTMLTGAQGLLSTIRDNQGLAEGENLAFAAAILDAMGVDQSITNKLRLGALALEGDELAPELKAVIDNVFGGNDQIPTGEYDEFGDPIMRDSNPIAGFMNGALDTWADLTAELKVSLNQGMTAQQALKTAIDKLNSILPTLGD